MVWVTAVLALALPVGCRPAQTTPEADQELITQADGSVAAQPLNAGADADQAIPPEEPDGNPPDKGKPSAGRKGFGKQGPGKKGRSGGQRTNPVEQEIIAMLERVGGTFRRIDDAPGGPLPIGVVRLPGTKTTIDDLLALKKLRQLTSLTLEGPAFNDKSLSAVLTFPELSEVHLTGESFSDQGMAELAKLEQLQVLILEKTAVTAQGLKTISGHDALQFVDFLHTPISEDLLEGIKQLRKLREIRFIDSKIEDSQLEQLKQQLPDCDFVVTDHVDDLD